MSQPNDHLLIDLTNARHATALDANSILHRMQVEAFLNRVDEVVAQVEFFCKRLEGGDFGKRSVSYERYHDVITLHGKRGSGKTTFLLSVLKLLQKSDARRNAFSGKNWANLDRLCVLEILDPTLFGLHEHLLLSLLAKIVFEVRAVVKRGGVLSCDNQEMHCKLEKWEKNLRRFAKSLKYMGEIRDDLEGTPPKETVPWEDAEFIFEQNMDNAQNSFGLEQEFHRFLKDSLELLRKDAFVLALDDIDTRPQIGWHVLEVLRRYFTSPQLVVIISGDIDLFKLVIEKQQLNIFGLNFTSNKSVISSFKAKIDSLTEQYMLKVLRAPSRINLGSFSSAVNKWKNNYPQGEVVVGSMINNQEIDVILRSTLYPLVGCYRNGDQKLFRQVFLNNPARTVTQVLDALWTVLEDFNRDNKSGGMIFDQRSLNSSSSEFIISRLREVFLVSLQGNGIDRPFDFAEDLQSSLGLTYLVKQLFARGGVVSGLDLLPNRQNQEENNALLVLSAELTQAMHSNIALSAIYAMKLCLLREVLVLQDSAQDARWFRDMYDFINFNKREITSYSAARISIVHICGAARNKLRNNGVLQMYSPTFSQTEQDIVLSMYGCYPPARKNFNKELFEFRDGIKAIDSAEVPCKSGNLKKWFNSPESLGTAIDTWQNVLPWLGVIDVSRQGGVFRYFSIFSFIAVIADILACADDEIASTISRYGKPFASCEPRSDGKIDDDGYYDAEDLQKEPGKNSVPANNEVFDQFVNSIVLWKRKYLILLKKIPSPTVLCARTMERFFGVLKSIDVAHTNNSIYLGKYIHRCLVAFFNSILIEEAFLSGHKYDGLTLKNAITRDDNFIANVAALEALDKNDGNIDGLVFFYMVFSFPLWRLYIKPNGGVFDLLNQYDSIDDSASYCQVSYMQKCNFGNLYYPMNSILIKKKR